MSNYFYIQSQLNHFVLSIDGFELGGDLVMYPAYGGANQLWQWGGDNTLVSKMGLVADIQGGRNEKGTSCIGWYPNSGQNQKWCYENGTIKSTMNNLVMDIAEEGTGITASVHTWEVTGSLGQKWALVPANYQEEMPNYFYLQSQLNQLVLTIDGFKNGGTLVMYPAYGGANQLWQWGGDDTLVSKMGLVVDIQGARDEEGTPCIGWYPNSGQNQKWRYENGTIQSTMNNLVLDVGEEGKGITASVQTWEGTGSLAQKWALVPENNGNDISSNFLVCYR